MNHFSCNEESKANDVVQCYHDYSSMMTNEATTDEAVYNDPKTKLERNFPLKLHFVLAELVRDGYADIASWAPHGRCFIVHKPKEFEERVLSKWFRQTKYTSFQRQLNLYGFNRITKGLDRHGYYHERFLRCKAFLSANIKRMKVKGKGARKPSTPDSEPDFYSMSFLPQCSVLARGCLLQSPSQLPVSRAAIQTLCPPSLVMPAPWMIPHLSEASMNAQLDSQRMSHPVLNPPFAQAEYFDNCSARDLNLSLLLAMKHDVDARLSNSYRLHQQKLYEDALKNSIHNEGCFAAGLPRPSQYFRPIPQCLMNKPDP